MAATRDGRVSVDGVCSECQCRVVTVDSAPIRDQVREPSSVDDSAHAEGDTMWRGETIVSNYQLILSIQEGD